MNKRNKLLTEAILIENYYKLSIICENSQKYAELIEQGILNRFKRVAKQTVGSWPGFGVEAGGESPTEVELQHPENAKKIKALESDLKNVSTKEKELRGMKIGNDVLALDNAMYHYVDSLINLYGKHKDIINDEKMSDVFPGSYDKIKAAFETARSILKSIQKAAGESVSKISVALKGSKLEERMPKSTIASAPPAAGTNFNKPRQDMPARAKSSLTRGVTGGFQPTMEESIKAKKLPSLKEVCKLD